MSVLRVGVAASLFGLLLVTGCTTSPPEDTRLKISASFYPLEFVASRVAGKDAVVTNLTRPGSEPHDLELTPSQVASIQKADMVVYQAGFQPAVDAAITQTRPANVVDTSTFLTFRPGPDGKGSLDPHTWLDPTSMVKVAQRVRDALAQERPDLAGVFATNTASLIDELNQLDVGIAKDLNQCQLRTFITSHTAFGYFAARYRLTEVGGRGLEPDVEPSPARIAEVQRIARETGVTTIFFETLVSPSVAESIAADLGLRTDVLDPIEGITDQSRGSDYLQVMRANTAALAKANQCH